MTKYQTFARENYKPGEPLDEMWHPDVIAEAQVMNEEVAAQRKKDRAKIKEVVLSVDEMEEEFKGNIVLMTSFTGSLAKTRKLTAAEKLVATKGLDPEVAKKIGLDKPLFGKFEALDDLERRRNEWRNQYKALGIPFIGDGMTVLNVNLIPEAEVLGDLVDAELPGLVQAVIDGYKAATTPEVVGIGPLYNERDYKQPDSLRLLFKHSRKWMHFGVPEILKEIDQARWEAERKRTASVWAEVKQSGTLLLREMVSEMVDRLVDTVTPKEGGDKKKFYATAVTNLTEFFETFDKRNIAGDTELAAQVTKLKDLIAGKDIKNFKDDEALRNQVKKAGQTISAELKTMVIEAGARIITFED